MCYLLNSIKHNIDERKNRTHFCSSYFGTAPQDLQNKITTNKAPSNLNKFALSFTIFTVSEFIFFAILFVVTFFFLCIYLIRASCSLSLPLSSDSTHKTRTNQHFDEIFSYIRKCRLQSVNFEQCIMEVLRITFWISRSF